jgi:hypothetical protein
MWPIDERSDLVDVECQGVADEKYAVTIINHQAMADDRICLRDTTQPNHRCKRNKNSFSQPTSQSEESLRPRTRQYAALSNNDPSL